MVNDGEYRRMSMMPSSLVLSRGGVHSNATVVEMGNDHHQSYYTADSDESGRRSKSYKASGGSKGGGKLQVVNAHRDVLKPKSRTAASSSPLTAGHSLLYRIVVFFVVCRSINLG